jgi:hypothetical protein
MFAELGMGDVIDQATHHNLEIRDLTVGEAVKAMALNGLGFINQARSMHFLVLDSEGLSTNTRFWCTPGEPRRAMIPVKHNGSGEHPLLLVVLKPFLLGFRIEVRDHRAFLARFAFMLIRFTAFGFHAGPLSMRPSATGR